MSQNKLRGGKESERSYSPHLCKDKGSAHWQYYFYLYFYQKSLSQNNYKASKSAKDLKISLNQLKANDESL